MKWPSVYSDFCRRGKTQIWGRSRGWWWEEKDRAVCRHEISLLIYQQSWRYMCIQFMWTISQLLHASATPAPGVPIHYHKNMKYGKDYLSIFSMRPGFFKFLQISLKLQQFELHNTWLCHIRVWLLGKSYTCLFYTKYTVTKVQCEINKIKLISFFLTHNYHDVIR